MDGEELNTPAHLDGICANILCQLGVYMWLEDEIFVKNM